MRYHTIFRCSRLLAGAALAFGLLLFPVAPELSPEAGFSLGSQAAVAQSAGGGQGQSGAGQGSGGGRGQGGAGSGSLQGQRGSDGYSTLEERIFRGKGRRTVIIIEEGHGGLGDHEDQEDQEDSGRPAWAGGNRDLNPHSRGDGRPLGSGMGDLYGDLWAIVRDDNGEPLLDANGNVQPILVDGSVVQLTEDGELPSEYEDQIVEVELGRLNVSRSPDHVTNHAFNEVLSKLATADTVTIDEAGRLVVDGTTIDSPLENLALYTYVMSGGDVSGLNLPPSFGTAAMLGAAADKTQPITLDKLIYLNSILGINTVDVASGNVDYFDFSAYDYSRAATYAGLEVTYLADPDGDGVYDTVNESVMQAVFGGEDWADATPGGADDFSQSADDSRAIIQFLHDRPSPLAIN